MVNATGTEVNSKSMHRLADDKNKLGEKTKSVDDKKRVGDGKVWMTGKV
jgi:hypothetical protein